MSINTPPSDVIFRASNRAHMKRWVLALESGAYKQGKDELRRVADDGSVSYCCLGVATEVAMLNGVEEVVRATNKGYRVVETGLNENGHLPRPVKHWLGLSSNNPTVGYRKGEVSSSIEHLFTVGATRANDSYRWDFPQIAKWLRYVYMIDWTDDQVREAMAWNHAHGAGDEAAKIGQRVFGTEHDYATLPAAPSLDDVTTWKLPTHVEAGSEHADGDAS